MSSHALDPDALASSLAARRSRGLRVALCHGVFDLLHPGHLRHLSHARSLADILVVSITADAFVTKGPGRPAFPENLRAEALAALRVVDHVVITRDSTALPTIRALTPDFYVKGSDYADPDADPTGNIARERALLESEGGTMIFTDDIVFSSSALLNRFLPTLPEGAMEYVRDFGSRHSAADVLSWLDRIRALRTTIVGEAIIDVYTTCEVLGKASKDPILCLRRNESFAHSGGALAIAAHCRGLGADTRLLTAFHERDEFIPQIRSIHEMGIGIRWQDTSPRPTIRKERLVDERIGARLFEFYEMDDSIMDKPSVVLARWIEDADHDSDVVIVADYGHGLIGRGEIESLGKTQSFLAINTQANAGNRGLNSLSRYGRADFIALNASEVRLELRNRDARMTDHVPAILHRHDARLGLVTTGLSGLDLYSPSGLVSHAPALTPHVKDRVGAGDAVLAVTAMLAALDAPPEIIAFCGAVVGAWAVGFTGNEQTLTHGVLSRHVASLLK